VDIYFKKRRWKQLIFLFAILIGIGSLLYTNQLVEQTSKEERIKVERWAEAIRILVSSDELDTEVSNFLNDILTNNTTIPLIVVTDSGKIYFDGNIKYNEKNKEKVLEKTLAKMKARQDSIIVIPISENDNQYLYYRESSLQTKLKYYPILQLLVVVIFIGASYFAFSSSRKAEQNLVWVGMAKETAHQLGTPISSLMAWTDLLEEENVNPEILKELSKDTDRLMKITERFSKVGSNPELYPENIYEVLQSSVEYLEKRVSKKITFQTNFQAGQQLYLPLSASLFSWVIENLVRNSVDAMGDKSGLISIVVTEREQDVEVDVSDNGKGIPKSKFKTIFEPGYTTKKRGWGLGLSLSRRIIKEYHKGKIFLKSSEPNKLTTFRIILKKDNNFGKG
jgi:anti-sigma regulatory factor (Ser/Thr protein kinase)